MTSSIPDRLDWSTIRLHHKLSRREADVAQGICRGLKIMEIARRLDLCEGTVKTYCRRLYRKLGVDSQCSLALVIAATGHPTLCSECPEP